MLVRNNSAITREAIESVLAQTISVSLIVIDNGSTDGATQYLNSLTDERVNVRHFHPGKGVAASWNLALRDVFAQADHALVVNNDVLLRPDTYELLIADGGEFVTAVGVRGCYYHERRNGLKVFRDDTGREIFPGGPLAININGYGILMSKRPHPDFSCFMIRRSVWQKVGPFDEGFRGAYAEDSDYHVRMHKAGVDAHCIDLPFYHYGAGTIAAVNPDEVDAIHQQAAANREYFKSKWGCEVGSDEYYHGIFGHDAPSDTPRV